MEVRVLCFGAAREITSAPAIAQKLNSGTTVADLRRSLIEAYPELGDLNDFAIARNETYANEDEMIEAGDELAIIPPVSGG